MNFQRSYSYFRILLIFTLQRKRPAYGFPQQPRRPVWSKENQPDLSKITGLQHLTYKSIWDSLADETAPPELQPQLVGLYEAPEVGHFTVAAFNYYIVKRNPDAT